MPNVIKVFAPASVANVGVGFDALGFAIEGPGDEIIVRPGTNPGLRITSIKGAKNKLPLTIEDNTAGYAAWRFLKSIGAEKEPIELEIHKKMPFGSGLGSSAASAVAGVYGVSKFLKTGHEKIELLPFAVEGEAVADGAIHADNVAPSLLGGMTLIRNTATCDVKKLHVPSGLRVVVVHPHIQILTKDSRSVLRSEVKLQDHIQQSANFACFVAAMYTSDFDLMRNSLDDVIIEPQRAHLIPHFYDMKTTAMNEGAIGFSISGAGPSVFALCDNTLIAENIAERIKELLKKNKISCTPIISPINHEGAFKY